MKNETLKILMLEDSNADVEMIQRELLKDCSTHTFKVVMTEAAYLDALQEFKPDIILSDNAMPQFSASEALHLLKQLGFSIPFILITGTVSEEFAAGIIKAGADDYLLKDRLTRLPAAIEAALKQNETEKENKEAAKRLKESEEKYRALIEQASDGIFIANQTGRYTDANESICKLLGYTKDELLQLEIKDLLVIDEDYIPPVLQKLTAAKLLYSNVN